ncbi:hypothetical protein P9X10_02290 [Bacillus cereus]|nr:hypothetical protein [Bacillus cereus]
MSFQQTIYNELKSEVTPTSSVIVFDKDSYLIGIATNEEELVTLLKKKNAHGVVLNKETSIGYIISNQHKSVNTIITGVNPQIDYAMHMVVGKISSREMPNVVHMYQNILSNNEYLEGVYKRLLNFKHLQVERFSNRMSMYIPNEFVTIGIQVNNLSFYLSELQLSIVTKCGSVIVHDKNKDMYINEITELVADSWGISEKAVSFVLTGQQ